MALIKLKGSTEEHSFLIESKSIQAVSKSRSENLYKIDTGKPSNNDFFLTLSTPEEILYEVEKANESNNPLKQDINKLVERNFNLQCEVDGLKIEVNDLESALEDKRKAINDLQNSSTIKEVFGKNNIPEDQIEVLELLEGCFIKLSEKNPELKEKVEEFKMMVELLKIVIKSRREKENGTTKDK